MRASIIALIAGQALSPAAFADAPPGANAAATAQPTPPYLQGFEGVYYQPHMHPVLDVDTWGASEAAACAVAKAHCPTVGRHACVDYGPSPCTSAAQNVCVDHALVNRSRGP